MLSNVDTDCNNQPSSPEQPSLRFWACCHRIVMWAAFLTSGGINIVSLWYAQQRHERSEESRCLNIAITTLYNVHVMGFLLIHTIHYHRHHLIKKSHISLKTVSTTPYDMHRAYKAAWGYLLFFRCYSTRQRFSRPSRYPGLIYDHSCSWVDVDDMHSLVANLHL